MENIEINYTNVNSGNMQQIINGTGSEHTKDTACNEDADSLNCLSNPNTVFKEYQISGHTDVLNHLNKEFIDKGQSNNGCTDFINSASNGYSGFLDHSIECDDTYRFNNEHPDVIEHSPNEHTYVTEVSSNNQPCVMNYPITPVKSYIQSPGKRINDVSVEDAQNSAEITENGFPDVSIEHSAEVLSCLLDSGKRVNELPVEVAQSLSERTENGFPDVTIAHSAEVFSCLLDSGKRVNELPVEVAQSLSEKTENGFPDVSVEHSAEVPSSLLDSGKRANELPVEVAQSLSEITENGFPDVTVLTLNFDEEKYDSCNQKSDNNIQEKEIVETIKSSPCQENNAAVISELLNNAAVTSELLNKQTFDQAQKDDKSENSLHKNHSQIESQSSENQHSNHNQHLNQSDIVVSKKTPELESVIIEDNLFLKETPELESVINENLFSNETHELESVINEKILFLKEVPKLETVKNEECLFNKELKTETDNFTSIQKDILLQQPQNIIFNPDLNHNTENKKETSESINTPDNNPKKETSDSLNAQENNPKKETSDSLNARENNPKKETSDSLNTPESNPKKEMIESLNTSEVEKEDKTYSKLPTAKNEDIVPLHLPLVEQDLVQLPSVAHEKKETSDFTTENKDLSSVDQKKSLTSSPTVKDDTEWLDILGNGLLKKKVLKKGLGHKSRPVSGDIVTIKCKGMLSDGTIVDAHDSLQFVLSDEEVIQAFDLSVALMENTEVACIFTDARYAYGIYGRPSFIPPIPQNASLTYEVEILSVKPGPDITQLSSEERIKYANAKRERGNELYMIGDHSSSINVYKRGLKYVEGSSETNVLEMKVKLLNNLSAAQLKVNAYAMAIVSLDSVLRVEPKNTKALFRKGKCLEGLGNDEEALKCLKEASTLDPHNKLIHQDIAKVRSRLAVTQKKEKEIYEKMFSQKKKEKVIQNEPSVWPYIIGSSLVAAIGVISGILWFRKHS